MQTDATPAERAADAPVGLHPVPRYRILAAVLPDGDWQRFADTDREDGSYHERALTVNERWLCGYIAEHVPRSDRLHAAQMFAHAIEEQNDRAALACRRVFYPNAKEG